MLEECLNQNFCIRIHSVILRERILNHAKIGDLVGIAGFEPAITESKSVALPLGHTPKNIRGKRQVLAKNRDKNLSPIVENMRYIHI